MSPEVGRRERMKEETEEGVCTGYEEEEEGGEKKSEKREKEDSFLFSPPRLLLYDDDVFCLLLPPLPFPERKKEKRIGKKGEGEKEKKGENEITRNEERRTRVSKKCYKITPPPPPSHTSPQRKKKEKADEMHPGSFLDIISSSHPTFCYPLAFRTNFNLPPPSSSKRTKSVRTFPHLPQKLNPPLENAACN